MRLGYRPAFSEILLHHGAPREIRLRPGSECPEKLLAAARLLFRADADWALAPAHYGELGRFVRAARKAGHELRCADEALAHVAGLRDAARRRTLVAEAFPRGAASPALRKLLQTTLYPYQAEGALFALAAGILGGGGGEVTLDGTRLSRFVHEVEQGTGGVGDMAPMAADEKMPAAIDEVVAAEPLAIEATAVTGTAGAFEPQRMLPTPASDAATGDQAAPTAGDPWAPLLDFGAQVLGALAAGNRRDVEHPWVERDAATGRSSLRIPMPPPEVGERLAATLMQLAAALRPR